MVYVVKYKQDFKKASNISLLVNEFVALNRVAMILLFYYYDFNVYFDWKKQPAHPLNGRLIIENSVIIYNRKGFKCLSFFFGVGALLGICWVNFFN
jgi:hypothetical protein